MTVIYHTDLCPNCGCRMYTDGTCTNCNYDHVLGCERALSFQELVYTMIGLSVGGAALFWNIGWLWEWLTIK